MRLADFSVNNYRSITTARKIKKIIWLCLWEKTTRENPTYFGRLH